MSASLGTLIAPLRPFARALVDVAGRAGLLPRVTSTRRSHAQQAQLYRRFLAGYQQYPVAPPGTSAHEFGYAFDMVIAGMSLTDLRDLGTVWEGWGGVWGGEFKDPIHFEYPGFKGAAIAAAVRRPPPEGGPFYELANFLSGFIPGLGEVQLVDTLVSAFDGNSDIATFYVQHPAEALRDLWKILPH